jgi:hypothetical protein
MKKDNVVNLFTQRQHPQLRPPNPCYRVAYEEYLRRLKEEDDELRPYQYPPNGQPAPSGNRMAIVIASAALVLAVIALAIR